MIAPSGRRGLKVIVHPLRAQLSGAPTHRAAQNLPGTVLGLALSSTKTIGINAAFIRQDLALPPSD